MSRFEAPAWRERACHAASACSVALAPVVVLQGRRVRRLTPRLPEAGGPSDGEIAGADPPIRLLLIGESTAAGVGVASHDEGLAGEVSRTLAAATERRVLWMVRGRNGATAESTRVELLPQIGGFLPDVTVVVLGVNDTLRLTRPRRFIAALDALATALRVRQPSTTLVIAAVPPMGRFPALPAPLRQVLGLRARVLDLAAVRFARGCARARHVPMPMSGTATTTELFAADGFHPSAPGYQAWGHQLGEACAAVLAGANGGSRAGAGVDPGKGERMKRAGLGVVAAVMGLAVGLLNAVQLSGRIRMVDILTLFASGVAAGAGLVKAMVDLRQSRRSS